jgi:hypothetical protein
MVSFGTRAFRKLMHWHISMCAGIDCTDLKPGQAAVFDVVINAQYRNCINKKSYGSYIACDTGTTQDPIVSLSAFCA